LSSCICGSKSSHDRLFSHSVLFGTCSSVSFCEFQCSVMFLLSVHSAFDSCHFLILLNYRKQCTVCTFITLLRTSARTNCCLHIRQNLLHVLYVSCISNRRLSEISFSLCRLLC